MTGWMVVPLIITGMFRKEKLEGSVFDPGDEQQYKIFQRG